MRYINLRLTYLLTYLLTSNPDLVQKLISWSMSRHLSTRNILSKSMHAFLSNLVNRQTDKHRQKHLPSTLSEVNSDGLYIIYSFYDHCNSVLTYSFGDVNRERNIM